MIPIGRLHLITNATLQQRWSHLELARLAVTAGADVVQYREKSAPTRRMLEEALAIQQACRRKGVKLIVNDRVDVALAADASGVHLGDEDLPIALARGLLGPHRIIGSSADSAAEANARRADGADYAGIGPIFPTGSKSDAGAVLGLDRLRTEVQAAEIPLIAIGGITQENVASVMAKGVHGVAILSAFCCADDPAAVAAELKMLVERGVAGPR
jgi:thiamine-phosphate pyrophosphorylase